MVLGTEWMDTRRRKSVPCRTYNGWKLPDGAVAGAGVGAGAGAPVNVKLMKLVIICKRDR
jgi:hypothetical protein